MNHKLFGTVFGALSMASVTIFTPMVQAQGDTDLTRQVQDLQRRIEQQDNRLNQQQERLEQANNKIANLRENQKMHYLAERRADEVRAMITEVLEDSASRDTGVNNALQRQTAGWDENEGFFIRGYMHQSFLLRIGGYIQARGIYNYSDNPATANQENLEYGFEVSRARLRFSGHVISPDTKYYIDLEFGRRNGVNTGTLREAWIAHSYSQIGLTIVAGQFKTPFLREYMTDASKQQFVDYSIIANTFGGGYTQGMMAIYDYQTFRTYAALTNGVNSANNWNNSNIEYAATTRVEWLPYGLQNQGYDPLKPVTDIKMGVDPIDPREDFQGWLGTDVALIFGAGFHAQQGDNTTGDNDTLVLRWNIDAAFELNGLSVYFLALGNHHVDGQQFDEYAFQTQVGYFVFEQLEFVGRFEYIRTDRPDTRNLKVLTIGMNYFFERHRYKVSADIAYSFSPMSAFYADESIGWRQTDGDNSGDQIVIRIQVQLMF